MMEQRHILVIEDDPLMRLGMKHFLVSQGYAVSLCEDGIEGLRAVENPVHDLIITDLKLPHHDGFQILEKARTLFPQTGVIMVTGYAEVKSAVQAIKDGAFDYIAKPFSNEELLVSVERFFKFRMLEDEVTHLKEALREKAEFEDIVGESPTMKAVFDRITTVAGTNAPVLIQGESGTGKELVARAIHQISRRRDRPFIAVNAGAFASELFSSEFFGHEKGAFTGAIRSKAGFFEEADGGTLLLDEIGELEDASAATCTTASTSVPSIYRRCVTGKGMWNCSPTASSKNTAG
jgi:DNA-binding NtrC family response regulator